MKITLNGHSGEPRTVERRTGYLCCQYGRTHWHRTLAAAVRRAEEFWARDFSQVIDCATGEPVYGRPQ